MNFQDFNFSDTLYSTLLKVGYKESTPIQAQTIPHVLKGQDVAGLAQTGTGKTAAFLLPLMERVIWSRKNLEQLSEEDKKIHAERAFVDWKPFHYILVLVPTRELADQVLQNLESLGADANLRGAAIYGGTGYDKQKDAVRRGVEFIIATPGRLIDLFKENVIDLKLVRAIVFDEADRMFDMGFKDDMKYILQRVPKERQFLVFSATLNFDVLNTAYQFGANPIEVNISKDQTKAENVKDDIFHVGQEEKPQFLLSIIKKFNPKQTIIFSNYKTNIDRIVAFLNLNQVPAMGISSLLTQGQRNKVIEQFKAENDHNILVATDVAARGLDIKGVDLVVNFDLPSDSESYVHRIGRTGRAGAEGRAISFVSDRDVDALMRIEEYLKHKISALWLEDVEIIKDFKPMPRDQDNRDRKPRSFEGGGDRRFSKEGRPSRRQGDRPERGERPQFNRGAKAPYRPGGVPKPAVAAGERPNKEKTSAHAKPQHGGKSNKPHNRFAKKDHQHKPYVKPVPKKQDSLGKKVVGFLKSLFK